MIEVKQYRSERSGKVFATEAEARNDEGILDESKIEELFTRIDLGLPWTPKVGDVIYVRTSGYIDRGADDVEGGLALVTVSHPDKPMSNYHLIKVAQHPGHGYYWNSLEEEQAKLRTEFKRRVAYPDPDFTDYGPSGY